MMKLRQLHFVRAVAQTGSFSRAAQRCNATQPTLSNAISSLEEEMGGRLFGRTTREVRLTAFGRHLLPFIDAVLDAKSELETMADMYLNPVHNLLRIGVSPLVDAKFLDRALEGFRAANPDVEIFFKECLLEDLSGRLAEDVIDIAVVPSGLMPREYGRCGFYSDPLYYLPSGGGAAAALPKKLRIGNLPDAPIITTGGKCGLDGSLETVFASQGEVFNRYPGQALSYQMIADWSDVGVGAGILPFAKIRERACHFKPVYLNDGRQAVISYEWIWMADRAGSGWRKSLLPYVKEHVPEIVSGPG